MESGTTFTKNVFVYVFIIIILYLWVSFGISFSLPYKKGKEEEATNEYDGIAGILVNIGGRVIDLGGGVGGIVGDTALDVVGLCSSNDNQGDCQSDNDCRWIPDGSDNGGECVNFLLTQDIDPEQFCSSNDNQDDCQSDNDCRWIPDGSDNGGECVNSPTQTNNTSINELVDLGTEETTALEDLEQTSLNLNNLFCRQAIELNTDEDITCPEDTNKITCGEQDVTCESNQVFNRSKTWCASEEPPESDLKEECCVDKVETVDQINFIKLFIYTILTAPVTFIIIYKLRSRLLIKSNTNIKSVLFGDIREGSYFTNLFNSLSQYTHYIAIAILLFILAGPAIRYFIISFRCSASDAVEHSKCNNYCSVDSDCSSLHGSCNRCINNRCQEHIGPFDQDNYLTGSGTRETIIYTCQPDDDINEGKFLLGQTFYINNTHTPFHPTLNGEDKFNNFIIPQELETDDLSIECPEGYTPHKLPQMEGIFSLEIPDYPLSNSNRVFRDGIDVRSDSSVTNGAPCDEINISGTDKINSKGELGSWVDDFEISREDCGNTSGQCYMKDYPCQTEYGVPIPLKHYDTQHNGAVDYTIGDISDSGCKMAAYPCSNVDNSCTYLSYNDGKLVEGVNLGTCKRVSWEINTWVEGPESDTLKCLPTDYFLNPPVDLIPGAKMADGWDSDEPATTKCQAVERYPRVDYSGELDPFFRWESHKPNNNMLSCHDLDTDPCTEPNILLNYATYNINDGLEGACCGTISQTSYGNAG